MDVSTLRAVVLGLVVICCLCVGGLVICSAEGRDAPPSLGTIAGTTCGALVTVLLAARGPGPGQGGGWNGNGPATRPPNAGAAGG